MRNAFVPDQHRVTSLLYPSLQANRARNIRNKPVVNRDPVAAQIAQLRQACSVLRAENASLR